MDRAGIGLRASPCRPLQGAADVAPAIAAIAAAAAEGAISTAEACEMSQVVERYMRALGVEEIETRLRRLESLWHRCIAPPCATGSMR